jgi:hypothetical protein
MNDQQPVNSFENISDLMEKINRLSEEETKKRLNDHIKKLEDLLKWMTKEVKEKTYLSEIRKNLTEIDMGCHKHSDGLMLCGYDITTSFYNEDKYKLAECRSNTISYKIKCTDYIGKSFELYDPPQDSPQNPRGFSFREGIKDSIRSIHNTLHPAVPMHMGDQYIHMRATVSTDPYKQRIENPVIIIDDNIFIYYNGRSTITMFCNLY